VISRLEDRINQEASPEQRPILMTAAYVLSGLRVTKERAKEMFKGVRAMRDSTTYQGILEEGREEGRADEARKILLRQGHKRFGQALPEIKSALEALTDLERMERMSEALLDAGTWQELLSIQ
jgi:predicted transposase YdaD